MAGGVRESASQIAAEFAAEIERQERATLERAVDDRAEEMRDYAISISPEDSGEYKDAFEITEVDHPEGLPARSLTNTDPKAPYLEFGTEDTPEFAVLTRTEAHFSQRGGDL